MTKSHFVHVQGVAKGVHKPGPHVRLVTFNVHYGKNPSAIVNALRGNKNLKSADIILIQEIEYHETEKVPRAEVVAQMLDMHYVYAPARSFTKGTHGLAILSHFPILDVEIIPLTSYALIPRSRNRIALNVSIDINGIIFKIINIHLDTRINAHERLEQLKPVIDRAAYYKENPMIIAGDFNTLPAYFYKRLVPIFIANQKMIVDSFFLDHGFKSHIEEIRYTMRRGFIRFNLDSIYIRGGEALQYGLEENVTVSDHRPLWVDIAIKRK
jgi:endonuclease/exonuclease/phosphatase family metal-dependent hydrolase